MSLLLLFNFGEGETILPESSPPSLPDLHIKDSETFQNVPVSGLTGYDNDYIQTVAVQYPPLQMYKATENPISESGSSAWLWTRRRKLFLVSLSFSSSSASAVIHIVIEDQNQNVFLLSKHSISPEDIEQDGRYLAGMLILETLGANKMKVEVESVSEGDVEIWLGAV